MYSEFYNYMLSIYDYDNNKCIRKYFYDYDVMLDYVKQHNILFYAIKKI